VANVFSKALRIGFKEMNPNRY